MATTRQTTGIGRRLSNPQFSHDIEAFISRHWQPGTDPQDWFHALHQRGWLVPDWPPDQGGPGWSRQEQWLWLQATQRHFCPLPDDRFRMLAPLLLEVGSRQQQEQYLPGILNRSTQWGIAVDTEARLGVTATADGWRLTGSLKYTPAPPTSSTQGTCFCLLLQDPEPQLDMTLLLVDLTSKSVIAGDGRLGSLSVTASNLVFKDAFISRTSLLGNQGQARQHLARHQSCYLILMELHLAGAHIARAMCNNRHAQGHTAQARRLTQFQIKLDAMMALFLRAEQDALLHLHSADMRTDAIRLLQDAMGYYLLLNGTGSLNSRLHTSNFHTSNEPRLPFEEEGRLLTEMQRHLGDALVISAQRDIIFKQL